MEMNRYKTKSGNAMDETAIRLPASKVAEGSTETSKEGEDGNVQ
jgi:hypothetical protein